MNSFFQFVQKHLADEKSEKRIVTLTVYLILGFVSLFMTLMNFATGKGELTVVTATFGLLSLVNFAITLLNPKLDRLARILFSLEFFTMFIYFLVSGNPSGFSVIWICVLPSFGMLFFGTRRGSILCLTMLAILVFFLWTPFGRDLLIYQGYNRDFRTRFPLLYSAFFALAFLIEMLRSHASTERNRLESFYRDLAIRDQLTGLYNRPGMYKALETNPEFKDYRKIGAVMIDIDYFKVFNDTYGHNAGDFVLMDFSAILKEYISPVVCRWGGEEFVVIYADDQLTAQALVQFKNAVENHGFLYEGQSLKVTASIGLCEIENFDLEKIDRLIDKADAALYHAKNTGRNKIVRYYPDSDQYSELVSIPAK